MKNNKIVSFILLILGIALITFGGYQGFRLANENKNAKTNKSEQEKYDKLLKVERNTSEKLKKERCLDKICFSNMEIFKEDGNYFATADITNRGFKAVENKYINVIFTGKNDYSLKNTHFIIKLAPRETQPFEFHFLSGDAMLKKVTDYKLEVASDKDAASVVIDNQ